MKTAFTDPLVEIVQLGLTDYRDELATYYRSEKQKAKMLFKGAPKIVCLYTIRDL